MPRIPSLNPSGVGPPVRAVRVLFLALLTAFAAVFAAGSAGAKPPAGTVYVMSNIGSVEGQNSILAYRRDDQTGKLTLFGTYLTGGTGTHTLPDRSVPGSLGTFDSDQNIITNPQCTLLFAVNGGSDTIAVFNIRRDGSLTPVKGSPFPSGGINPVSLGLTRNILVVINKDYDIGRPGFNVANVRPNYTTFRVQGNGRLTPIKNSTVFADPTIVPIPGNPAPTGSNPTQALISPNGRLLFDVDFFGFMLHTFQIRPNGRLVRSDSQRLPESETTSVPVLPIPLGQQVHPFRPILYVGLVLEQKLGVYTYDRRGNLTFVRTVGGNLPGDDTGAGSGLCWFLINRAATRLYSSNNFDNSVSVFDITDPLNPVKIQKFVLQAPAGLAFQIALDPTNRWLHVVSQYGADGQSPESNALHVLRLGSDGRVVEQTDRITLATDPSRPQGVIAK